jgi:hypothetical protein
MTPRLESLATFIAALIVIKNELSSQAEIREELSQAIEAFNKEIQAAQLDSRSNVHRSFRSRRVMPCLWVINPRNIGHPS